MAKVLNTVMRVELSGCDAHKKANLIAAAFGWLDALRCELCDERELESQLASIEGVL